MRLVARLMWIVFVFAVCLTIAPMMLAPIAAPKPVVDTNLLLACDCLPSQEEFAELLRTDAVAALRAAMSRYQCEIKTYRCIMLKRERIGGKLGKQEVIRVAFREEPFAVLMHWQEGAGLASATLYVAGENGGNLRAKSFLGITNTDPAGTLARRSARYTIQDFGIYLGTYRTYQRWKTQQDQVALSVEYLGERAIPELGGLRCYVVKRTCTPAEIDPFSMNDPTTPDAAKAPLDAIAEVELMFDPQTWFQVGSVLRHKDGSLLGSYFFTQIEINPTFAPDQFTPAALSKK